MVDSAFIYPKWLNTVQNKNKNPYLEHENIKCKLKRNIAQGNTNPGNVDLLFHQQTQLYIANKKEK